MKPVQPAPWRGRLLLVALGVLAAHAALLAPWDAPVPPPAPEVARFATRTVAPAAAPAPETVAATPAPVATPPAPPKAPRPRPAPRSHSEPAAAPELAAAAPEPLPQPQPLSDVEAGSALPSAAALAAASAGGPPQAVRLPAPVRMLYEVVATYRGLPLRGEGELNWRHDGKEYELQLEARSPLLGSRRQRSVGRVGAQGLEPLHFWDKARSEQATHFDRERGRVTFSNNQPDVPLAAGVQDRLSVILQLATVVGAQPGAYPAGTTLAVPTASVRDAETWFFVVEREEELALPGGNVRALKLQRLPRREYDQKVELWLAPRMDYAPVRIRLTSPNGDTVDQRWASTDRG